MQEDVARLHPSGQHRGQARPFVAQTDRGDLHGAVSSTVAVGERLVVELGHVRGGPRQRMPHQKHGRSRDPRGLKVLADVGQRAADDLLVRPGGVIHHGRRAVRPVMLRQHRRQLRHPVGREEDAQRRPRLGQSRKLLGRRHGRAAGGAREDDRLGDLRRGQFDPQRRRRRLKRADARHHFVVDPQAVQGVHLLADRPVDRRLAGVQADHVDLPLPRRLKQCDDLVEVHRGRIVPLGVGRQELQQIGIDQRAGVDAQPRACQEPSRLDGQQFGIARPGADKIDFHLACSFDSGVTTVTIRRVRETHHPYYTLRFDATGREGDSPIFAAVTHFPIPTSLAPRKLGQSPSRVTLE